VTVAKNLEVASLDAVNDGELALLSSLLNGLLVLDEGVEGVNVDGGAVVLLIGLVEVAHTNLTEETGVELVEVGAHVVETTGITTTTGVAAVLAYTLQRID